MTSWLLLTTLDINIFISIPHLFRVNDLCGKGEMDRRRFLKYLGGAAAATIVGVVAGKFVWDVLKKPPPPQDIVVIGAGLSGLTAAYLLTKEGKKVTVLEACHRPGGRIGTYRWPNGQYNDVGGEEFFYFYEDALWLLDELGLGDKGVMFTDSLATCFLRGKYIKVNWERWAEEMVQRGVWSERAKEGYLDLLNKVARISGPSYRGEKPWLYDYLISDYLEYDKWSFKEWLLDIQGYHEDVNWLIDITMKAEFGTTSDEVSAGVGVDYLYYWWLEPLFRLEGGNDQVITELVSRLPPGTVNMRSPVQRVANTPSGVEVQYGEGEVVEADAAIVTVPHTQALEIIENLPDDKREAMEKLIPTRLVYPFQQYSERFWRTAENSWTGEFLLTDLNPSWIVHGTALQDEETFGPKGILNQFVNQPEALELWSEQRRELNGFKGPHVDGNEAERITNALMDDMEQFWPEIRDFLETPKVFEYDYYGPARPPRYVLDGYYLKNREPFERIFFAGDWPFDFGIDAAVKSARHAVSRILKLG
jgi:monoamine oxidase